ncbi:MAG: NAD-dependent epimerase/dehydratase family protein [Parvibaculaceae bacterium]|nr:NAD-dependent epimerase/dehydratase family protein [Parvibaculaceae bacterium]
MADKRRKRKTLVTGATGFIGRHVVNQLLQQDHQVVAVSRTIDNLPQHKNLEHHSLDLHNHEAVADFFKNHQPSHLIHLAWEATPGLFWHSSENIKWLSSSITMLNHFITAGGETATLAGTCAEYEWENKVLFEDVSLSLIHI